MTTGSFYFFPGREDAAARDRSEAASGLLLDQEGVLATRLGRLLLKLHEQVHGRARLRAAGGQANPQVLRAELENLGTDRNRLSAVLDAFGKARLLSFDRDPVTRGATVEVAHEALIREWPLLREWLAQDREGLRVHRHLTEAAQEWELLEHDPGALYRGARLAQAREWAAAGKRSSRSMIGPIMNNTWGRGKK